MTACFNTVRRHVNHFAAMASGVIALATHAQTTKMASVGTGGTLPMCESQGTHCYSIAPSITPDGRHVVFASVVKNITDPPYTPTPIPQILVHDRVMCTTKRISQTSTGEPANLPCGDPSISADGQVIAFSSRASNFIAGVPNLIDQIYVYDAASSTIELVSKSAIGVPGNNLSGGPNISADGRYIIFQSDASNLVDDDMNDSADIFMFDRQTSTLSRISVSQTGAQGDAPSRRPYLSPNGQYVIFDSLSTNFTKLPIGNNAQVFLLDRDANGNGIFDEPGGTSLDIVSLSSTGEPANNWATWGSVSPDGQLIAFASSANNLVTGDTNGTMDIFVRQLTTGQTTRESVGPGGVQASAGSYFPVRISQDNRYITFHSAAQQLVSGGHNGPTHIIRRDLLTAQNIIISVSTSGEFANSSSEVASISSDGQTIAFTSAGANLVPGGTLNPNWVNVFVRSMRPADVTGDGVINVNDLLLVISHWGSTCSIADVNGDNAVNVSDLLAAINSWGQ